jgi:hypothetical protein
MATPDPSNVAPWYLRNINQALALDEVSGNVFVRTGFQGNIIITGNVEIPGTVTVNSSAEDPVHVHLDEIGTSGILDVPYMPIGGNVVITSGNINANVSGNVGVTGNVNIGTMPNVNAAVSGTVAVSSVTGNIAGITANVTVVDGGGSLTVDGNVGVTGNVNIGTMPNVNAAVTGTVAVSSISSNVTVVDGGGSLTVDGNVGVTGNVNIGTMPNVNANITGGNVTVAQGTDPWVVTGNLTATIDNNTSVIISGFSGATSDAFGRLRVSEPYTLFDTNNRYYDHNQFSTATSGTANVVYVENQSSFQLNVGSASGDSVIRETMKVFPYQPGKSQLSLLTFCMNTPKTNLRQRVGLFGANDGVFFENDGTYNYMVIRSGSTGVEERVRQDAWNGDRLNGAGGANNPSGITLYPNRTQIYYADVEWLGVGNVRVGFIINGVYILCHTFQHANQTGNTKVYMTTATLPIRYEITNTGGTTGASQMTQICSTVISEGGYNSFGTTQTAGTGTTQKRLSNANTYYPIVSIRLAPTRLDSIVFPRQIDVLSPSVNYYRWTLLQNATLTGATWAGTSPTGTVQYDLAATAVSGGTEIQTGYASARELTQLSATDFFQFQLGRTLAGVSDVVTLALAATANNADVLAELGWQELT